MVRRLETGRRAPDGEETGSAVVFLHGYGADGADLLGLAGALAPHLPQTLFLAPDAPEPCAGNPFGRQWFPIPRLDGSSPEAAAEGLDRAAEDLNAFIDDLLEETGLPVDKIALFGFSQGTMMALEVAPRRPAPLAAVVAFSGRLIAPEKLATEVVSKPPVMLIHGDADEMVPFEEMELAAEALLAAGIETYGHVMKGVGHGIAPDGLSVALAFLKDRLGKG